MNICVIGHSYIVPANRKKWTAFARLFPLCKLLVIFPTSWKDGLFTHTAKPLTFREEGVTFIALPASRAGNELFYSYAWLNLAALLEEWDPDVVHVEQGEAAYSFFQAICCSFLSTKKIKRTFFTWINWNPSWSLKYKLTWKWIERWNRFMSAGAVVGNPTAEKLLREKGFKKPICILPQLGVEQKEEVIRENKNKKIIAFVGRLVEEKGCFLLLEAFKNLSNSFGDWHLWFIGEGTCKKQLEEKTNLYALREKVQFLGRCSHEQTEEFYKQIDLLILPSYDVPLWKEQFGHVLIEAMAYGAVPLGSTAGDIPWVLQDKELVFEQKNVVSLINICSRYMGDEVLRSHKQADGLIRISKYYSHEAIARQLYNFFSSL